ncbi:hypothetical protein SeMB42_g04252 [Synchytrium endobioticum]|uniref:BHLH domain-containing protein n=1 Tax=Synchytrium endobioticum TaxID=286115 RepID=A0A507CZR9_9FUNG|nr:hypothetical protein SeLEV6574_g06694 [Synchytrium endobioticum]TPX44645.1 hypothetical protein SeMB42_g04252 [Synchytrium endobioticum]
MSRWPYSLDRVPSSSSFKAPSLYLSGANSQTAGTVTSNLQPQYPIRGDWQNFQHQHQHQPQDLRTDPLFKSVIDKDFQQNQQQQQQQQQRAISPPASPESFVMHGVVQSARLKRKLPSDEEERRDLRLTNSSTSATKDHSLAPYPLTASRLGVPDKFAIGHLGGVPTLDFSFPSDLPVALADEYLLSPLQYPQSEPLLDSLDSQVWNSFLEELLEDDNQPCERGTLSSSERRDANTPGSNITGSTRNTAFGPSGSFNPSVVSSIPLSESVPSLYEAQRLILPYNQAHSVNQNHNYYSSQTQLPPAVGITHQPPRQHQQAPLQVSPSQLLPNVDRNLDDSRGLSLAMQSLQQPPPGAMAHTLPSNHYIPSQSVPTPISINRPAPALTTALSHHLPSSQPTNNTSSKPSIPSTDGVIYKDDVANASRASTSTEHVTSDVTEPLPPPASILAPPSHVRGSPSVKATACPTSRSDKAMARAEDSESTAKNKNVSKPADNKVTRKVVERPTELELTSPCIRETRRKRARVQALVQEDSDDDDPFGPEEDQDEEDDDDDDDVFEARPSRRRGNRGRKAGGGNSNASRSRRRSSATSTIKSAAAQVVVEAANNSISDSDHLRNNRSNTSNNTSSITAVVENEGAITETLLKEDVKVEDDTYDNFVSSTPSSNSGKGKGRGKRRHGRDLLTEDEKRANHIASEQKRRDLLRNGFASLVDLVPGLKGGAGGSSKSMILERTVDFIRALEGRNVELAGVVATLERKAAEQATAGKTGYSDSGNNDDK